ncbi:hypothetical protein [Pseudomonas atacamensis]|uniref:hypothetical protein n=1 Tax=Pseudomonas atacamensis TaxID=2565368 RepID=UPI0032093B51
MNKLLELLENDRTLPIRTIKALGSHTVKMPLNLHPDSDLIKHDKHVDKDYVVEDTLDLNDDYPFILNARLDDYGYPNGKNLFKEFSAFRGIRYDLGSLDQRRSKINLRGVLTGSYPEMDIDIVCRVKIHAINSDDYAELELHESLAIEGYLLEQETNYKLALFMYFSAAESILRNIIEELKKDASKEEAKKLEHYALAEKAKIAGKYIFEVDDLKQLPIWGSLMGLLKSSTNLRNKITHAQKTHTITRE